MIFVTVGTHEQPFNRLIEYIDNLRRDEKIQEEIIMQTGYSTYKPKYCIGKHLLPYDEMVKYVAEARIVITHGGPASFIMPLQIGKVPIVVPRRHEFGEHVNNHQLEFAKMVSDKLNNIIMVGEIEDLEKIIQNYEKLAKDRENVLSSNNRTFNNRFEDIVNELVKDKIKKP